MKTLIIYDDKGIVFTQISSGYNIPTGLQHMEIEIPQGKFITGVDVVSNPHKPIYDDFPKSETEVLKAELQEVKNALNDIILNGGTL